MSQKVTLVYSFFTVLNLCISRISKTFLGIDKVFERFLIRRKCMFGMTQVVRLHERYTIRRFTIIQSNRKAPAPQTLS